MLQIIVVVMLILVLVWIFASVFTYSYLTNRGLVQGFPILGTLQTEGLCIQGVPSAPPFPSIPQAAPFSPRAHNSASGAAESLDFRAATYGVRRFARWQIVELCITRAKYSQHYG